MPTELTTFSTAGTFSYTIPEWCTRFDIICLGGGGGGQAGGALNSNGKGGDPGTWSAFTIVRGTFTPYTFSFGHPNLTVVVGAAGTKGLGPLKGVGTSGGASTVTSSLIGLLVSGAGGAAGSSGATGADRTGIGPSPTTYTFNGQSYTGGTSIASGSAGSAPGGGGCGGTGGISGGTDAFAGAAGRVWIYAHGERPAFFPMM